MSAASPQIIIPRKAIVRMAHRRVITMPPGMEPEWLAPQYRDGYVERCINWVRRQIACEACRRRRRMLMEKLRRYQRGNFAMFPAGTAAVAGASGECTATASAIPNLSDFAIEPGNAYTRARLNSDGDWYWTTGTTSYGTSRGTWQGSCAVADYDTRWNRISGDTPNTFVGSDGVWGAATSQKAVGYDALSFGTIRSGSFNLECRDGTTLTTLFTDSFTMYAEVDAKN